jgi:hypothetical protein
LGTTRRSAADPSPDGSVALFSYSQYSFKDESIKAGYEILDLATGKIDESGLNASEINEIVWLPGTSTGILYINATNEKVFGGVTLWIGDIGDSSARYDLAVRAVLDIVC